ncbi:MAG: glycosyl hydrolase family 65 protein [Spirochaetia bacterium]|jgi:kojibiose phosphorylase
MRQNDIPSGFCLAETGRDPRHTKHYEGAFAQGSGYLHVRGSYEEGLAAAAQDEEYTRLPANVTLEKPRHPRSKWGTYVPGITGQHPLLRKELVNLPYFMDLRVFANDERLDMDGCAIEDYERYLDLRDAVLYRRFLWKTRAGAVLEASYKRYVSRAQERVCVQEIDYQCLSGQVTLRIESGIDARVRTNGYNHFTNVAASTSGDRVMVQVTTDTGDKVALSSEARAEGMIFMPVRGDARRPAGAAERLIRPGDGVRIIKISAVATSRDPGIGESVQQSAAGEVDAAFAARQNLYAEHAAEWQEMWSRSAVTIEGDDRAQKAVRFALHHLLRAAHPRDARVAVCAKGSAGEAYFGHFFWDSEIYLLPFFLYSRPEAARALVEFRLNTLEGARRNARLYGYRGARYPWESSVTGDEQCPNWQYADFEIHVTADVAHAIRHYVAATGDLDLLFRATDVLVETARYWASRVERRPDGAVNLNGVMGPDEYTCFSNNNAYTNKMVKRSLRFTIEALEILEKQRPGEHAALVKRRDLSPAEVADFAAIAAALPVRSRSDGVVMQCDHFEDLERIDFHEVWKDHSLPFGHFVSQERNYRSQALKQADVLLLAYLFPADFPLERLAANYDYYEPLTTHDSSLSCVIHSILATRLGKQVEGYRFFERALGIDMDPDHGGAAEGIHIANCGGIWQAVVMGFAGMTWAYESATPGFTPRLPPHWRGVEFPLSYGGRSYSVRVTHTGVDIKEIKQSPRGAATTR